MIKTLYKLDSKGKVRVWNIWTEDGMLIQESGILDGKLVQHSKQCKSKNIGKSNETSPEEQAILELKSEYKGKLTEGYFETINEAQNQIVILPMLAKSYEDEKYKIDWANCYIQRKFDGMRCLLETGPGYIKLTSRDGKSITTMNHIEKDLEYLWKTTKKIQIFDGELYCEGLTFQENMKLIKKIRPETINIKFHCYDKVIADSFISRLAVIDDLFDSNVCKLVETTKITNELELITKHKQFISEGYEGSIIRWGNEGYKSNGRSSNLLKYKDFQDITAEIIDILPNDANPLHGTPLLKYTNKKLTGTSVSTFKAGVKMSHEDREDLLANKHNYIGKTAEIRFFEWTDEDNPRFPIMVGIRLDK